jgi:5'-3' exonuclease
MQQVLAKWAVPPAMLGDLLALAGDSSDNLPGTTALLYIYTETYA